MDIQNIIVTILFAGAVCAALGYIVRTLKRSDETKKGECNGKDCRSCR